MDSEIFLTMEEAKDAIYLDLKYYGIPEGVLQEIVDLAGGGWPDRFKEVRKSGEERIDEVIVLLRELLNSPTVTEVFLCAAFSLMFWGGVRRVKGVDGDDGVSLVTGLHEFTCLQCGQCCTNLDYSRALISEDITMWRDAGREDILAWVTQDTDDGGYLIWVNPDTGELEECCPFLINEKGRHFCEIHEIKPSICREYPATKKHGLMTDCPGVALLVKKESGRKS